MQRIDPFNDLVFHIAHGITKTVFLKKIKVIKKYTGLSYKKIFCILDSEINMLCKTTNDLGWMYPLPFEEMKGKKYWQLSQYIDITFARSSDIQADEIWNEAFSD